MSNIIIDGLSLKCANFPIQVEEHKKVISTPKESGHIQSRAGFTRSRRVWKLEWSGNNLLGKTIFSSLRTKRLALAGGMFNWYHPFEEETYTCSFIESSFSYKMEFPDYYSVSFVLQEL